MNQIESGIKVILHFEATFCSKIEGDWPCLILIFSDKHSFPLQPLFFAYEDRAQIIRLIVETNKQLTATINAEELAISAKLLREKTTSIMTDSVSKNLQRCNGVAKVLQLGHSNIHGSADIERQRDF